MPPLVQGIESSFISGLRAGLSRSPYLSDETRTGIAGLLCKDKSARQVGDALMISYASEWAKRLTVTFGSERVSSVWHGAERLFEPLNENEPTPVFPDFAVRKARFIEDFENLDLMARAILEVRFPSKVLSEFRSNMLMADFAYLDDGLRPLGFSTCTRTDLALREESVFRFFSLSALELGLYTFLGTSAPKFCLGPGVSSPGTFNAVHKTGYHLVGMPTHRRKAHGNWIPPLAFIWHDICHGAYWATHESPMERMAATLLYESAIRTMNGERRLPPVALQLDRLLDLELSMNGGLSGILDGLRAVLDPDRFAALVGDYESRLGDMANPLSTTSASRTR